MGLFRENAKLSDVAAAEIAALRAEGFELTPAEIVKINALGKVIECPESRLSLARGVPVSVGGATLWPLTLYGGDWFQRHEHDARGAAQSVELLAYSMAHGRAEMPEADVMRAVKAWVRGLRCRRQELIEAVDQVLLQDEDHPPAKSGAPGASFGDLSAKLAAMTGTPPEIWERHCSIAYCAGVLHAIVEQNAADGRAAGADVRLRAEKLMGLTLAKIRKRGRTDGA